MGNPSDWVTKMLQANIIGIVEMLKVDQEFEVLSAVCPGSPFPGVSYCRQNCTYLSYEDLCHILNFS